METTIQDYFNGLCCTNLIKNYNFDVESSDWVGAGITDQASFESVLGVTCGAFAITGNKIEADILTTSANVLNLKSKNITNVNYITVLGLQTLDLNSNQIITFNPIKALPSTLTIITFEHSEMTFFNPSIPLPQSLEVIGLFGNLIDNAGYTTSETWANSQPAFTNPCTIIFSYNTDSVTGTNLETILTTKNANAIP